MASSYLLAFAAWVGSLLIAAIRYGGHETVTTPAQGIQLVAMFSAAVVIGRTAWLLTSQSMPPAPPLRPPPLLWLLVGTTIRWMVLCLGGGIPAAVRALRDGPRNRRR